MTLRVPAGRFLRFPAAAALCGCSVPPIVYVLSQHHIRATRAQGQGFPGFLRSGAVSQSHL
jgi:hypothetical protein